MVSYAIAAVVAVVLAAISGTICFISGISYRKRIAEKEIGAEINEEVFKIKAPYVPRFTDVSEKYASLGYVPEQEKPKAPKTLVIGDSVDPTAEIDKSVKDAKIVRVNEDKDAIINESSTLFKFSAIKRSSSFLTSSFVLSAKFKQASKHLFCHAIIPSHIIRQAFKNSSFFSLPLCSVRDLFMRSFIPSIPFSITSAKLGVACCHSRVHKFSKGLL